MIHVGGTVKGLDTTLDTWLP